MHPQPDLPTISATLMALFEHAEMAKEAKRLKDDYDFDDDDDRDLADSVEVSEAKYNYPDLVPRTCSGKLSLREQPNVISAEEESSSMAVMSENFFLLAIFLGTCILLYFFPPGPWIFAYYS